MKVDVEYIPNSESHKFSLKFKCSIVEDNIKIEGKDKNCRRKHENLVGQRFIEGLEKEPMVSLSELVDLKTHYKQQ